MHKAFIIALAFTSLGALTTPALASKEVPQFALAQHREEQPLRRQEELPAGLPCTVSHDMSSSGKLSEQPAKM
jgi:hypothetical protein